MARTSTRLELYKKRLELYVQAEEAILSGAQSYQIGSRRLERGDLATIRSMIEKLLAAVEEEEAYLKGRGRRRTVGIIPMDW